jgi:hypothetical protein
VARISVPYRTETRRTTRWSEAASLSPTLDADYRKHLKRPWVPQGMGVEMEERKRRLAA